MVIEFFHRKFASQTFCISELGIEKELEEYLAGNVGQMEELLEKMSHNFVLNDCLLHVYHN